MRNLQELLQAKPLLDVEQAANACRHYINWPTWCPVCYQTSSI